jgi:hypothetical protein
MKEIMSWLSEAVSTTLAGMPVGGHKPTVMGKIDSFQVDGM